MTEVHPFYGELPSTYTHAVAIGGALITMVEPHVGHEYEYNRWYEDDHFYSGAMAMPWIQAGRRFVAPRDLQLLRYPEDSFIARPVTAGCLAAAVTGRISSKRGDPGSSGVRMRWIGRLCCRRPSGNRQQ